MVSSALSHLQTAWRRLRPAAPWLAALLVLLLGLLMAYAFWPARWSRPLTVRLTPAPREADLGLSASQRAGFTELVAEHLACLRDISVLRAPSPQPALELDPMPRREGERLACSFRWRQSPSDPWREEQAPLLPPREAVAWFLGKLPFRVPPDIRGVLLPQQDANLWTFLDLLAAAASDAPPPHALERARELCDAEPRCASAQRTRGQLAHKRLLLQCNRDLRLQMEAEQALQRSRDLLPGHPLSLAASARLRSDLGDHALALERLSQALETHPRVLAPMEELPRAARRAGLLDLALAALDDTSRSGAPTAGVELTCLYAGQVDRFEAGILKHPDPLDWEALFHLGYLRLLLGDRAGARQRFTPQAFSPTPQDRYESLCQVYDLICQERPQEARDRLRFLFAEQAALRAPDGEFTFKLAEALALCGDIPGALDMACRSAAQGFNCTEWFEKCPHLEPLRKLPRFQSLLNGMRGRQEALKSRYGLKRFGLP